MIIVKIIGGLGNQMFQYALARSLASRLNVPFKLDVSGFDTYTLHKYGLSNFNIVEEFAADEDIGGFRYRPQLWGKAIGLFVRFFGRSRAFTFVKENGFRFDPRILDLPDGVYLQGYWQSDKYFKNIETTIRKDFSFKAEPDFANKDAIRQLSGGETVSVHIRRGDYVSDPKANSVHGTASLEYYRAAMKYVASRVPGSRFFVFTDDPDWVAKHGAFEYPITLFAHNDSDKNFEDLRLMSLCNHNILANSSFSWWGAWLNANPDKIVVCPQKWFADTSKDTSDLLPDGWLRI